VSQNYSTRTLYLANYFDGEYPEDNENFAAYQTSEEAEARCAEEVAYQQRFHGPKSERHTTKEWRYYASAIEYVIPRARLSAQEQKLVERLKDCSKDLDVADRHALLDLIDRLRAHEEPDEK
jgi:hypothetical protein